VLLNIITPCVRKTNLPVICKSLRSDLTLIRWIIVLDQKELTSQDYELLNKLQETTTCSVEMLAEYKKWSVSGNSQRNAGINALKEGYVYFLDDDNIIHPNFWKYYLNTVATGKAFIGHQLLADGQLREAAPHYVKTSHIDAAQFCLPLTLIGSNRWKADAYEADGLFIGYLHHLKYKQFVFVNDIIAYYNRLSVVSTKDAVSD